MAAWLLAAVAAVTVAACGSAPRGPAVAPPPPQVGAVADSAPTAAPTAAAAPAPARRLLNSERIAQRFGSYGVEVLAADARVRVSNLYSGDGAERTCRTFAVVQFPPVVDPRVAAEHAAIVGGGSIGSVLQAGGWSVGRRHLLAGQLEALPPGAQLLELMRLAAPRPLAFEVYRLIASRDGAELSYATIAEIHHPEHLTPADLPPLSAPVEPGSEEAAELAAMVDLVSRVLASRLVAGAATSGGEEADGRVAPGHV